ncbi:undecaprenyl-phosphate galactose phosphotransferase WbaP [Veillonellaceae bacterium WCA-693-APC-5D-A]|uniref:Undecaprenyl-phosphate galactose phosphotransferase WbaP n=3 Tax=Anaerovibrio slackiae TaxID=2652309 RepID=A0A6I2UI66_9FIRM|nr:undecaprenyl-phosphate galactose phosphotransferase WbaP [Anaerovibrio slackiae]
MVGMHILMDYICIVLAEKTALWLQSIFRLEASAAMLLPWDYQYVYIPCMFLLFLFMSDSYRFNRPSLDMARDVFKGSGCGFLMYIMVIFLMRNSMQVSRYYAFCFLLFFLLYIFLGRAAISKLLSHVPSFREQILLIGAGKTAERLLSALEKDPCYCYQVAGILDDHPVSESLPGKYPVLGGFGDAACVIQERHIHTLIIAAPGLPEEGMKKLLYSVQHLTDTILFTPNLVGIPLGSVEISTLFVEQLTVIKSKNNLSRRANRLVKFVFDMVLTLVGTLAILPLLLALSILVGIDNKGRIFFAHRRVGRNGREFPCYKFQTMVPDADKVLIQYLSVNAAARREWEDSFKLTNDPRVTRLGAFLRKTSLDELPQVFNVLRGEMSLVGPRPIVRAEIAKYGKNIREYYMVRPGITGMWQTSGRSDTTYEERVAMDTWYVRNWSIWLDIKYLIKTFTTVISRKGAY